MKNLFGILIFLNAFILKKKSRRFFETLGLYLEPILTIKQHFTSPKRKTKIFKIDANLSMRIE